MATRRVLSVCSTLKDGCNGREPVLGQVEQKGVRIPKSQVAVFRGSANHVLRLVHWYRVWTNLAIPLTQES